MRFQSKYRSHKILYKGTRRYVMPGAVSPTIEPGIVIEFTGPQRIFDSKKLQELHGFDDETRIDIENTVLKHRHYGNGIYLAPGQELPEDRQVIARVKPRAARRFCKALRIDPETGELNQCQNEPTVGRDYCAEDDPDEAKVIRGLATTTD